MKKIIFLGTVFGMTLTFEAIEGSFLDKIKQAANNVTHNSALQQFSKTESGKAIGNFGKAALGIANQEVNYQTQQLKTQQLESLWTTLEEKAVVFHNLLISSKKALHMNISSLISSLENTYAVTVNQNTIVATPLASTPATSGAVTVQVPPVQSTDSAVLPPEQAAQLKPEAIPNIQQLIEAQRLYNIYQQASSLSDQLLVPIKQRNLATLGTTGVHLANQLVTLLQNTPLREQAQNLSQEVLSLAQNSTDTSTAGFINNQTNSLNNNYQPGQLTSRITGTNPQQ